MVVGVVENREQHIFEVDATKPDLIFEDFEDSDTSLHILCSSYVHLLLECGKVRNMNQR